MPVLKKPFPAVKAGSAVSYGGNQMQSTQAIIRKCGCGPVAALDLIRYLSSRENDSSLSLEQYNRLLSEVCRQYFPLIPPFGINGVAFVLGLNRFLRDRGLPYRAFWMLSGSQLWRRVETMLSDDLPVILSIGPNFPAFWQNNRLPLYTRSPEGNYHKAALTKGHFVTVTG